MSESKPKWAGAREGIQSPTVGEILDAIAIEVDRAIAKHGPWPDSCHHGHSVLLEEVEELWEEIKSDKGRLGPAKREAIQVAAVAVRYVMELCYHEQKETPHEVAVVRSPAKYSVLEQLTAEYLAGSFYVPATAFPMCERCGKRPTVDGGRVCEKCL